MSVCRLVCQFVCWPVCFFNGRKLHFLRMTFFYFESTICITNLFFETFTCFTSIMCYFWKDDIFNHERGYAESEVKKTSLLYDKNVKELFLCLRNLQGQNNNTKTRYGYIFIIQLNSGSFFLKFSIFCFSLLTTTSLKLVVRKCIHSADYGSWE